MVRRATGSTTDDYVIHALRQYVRGIPDSTDGLFLFFDLEYRGYFWIFPFVRGGERWANVGYGNATDNRRLKERFRYYCQTPEVRRCLGASRLEGKLVGFPLNLARFTWRGRLSRSLWGPGYVLLGDAASLIHPLSGEGISFAIESGRIAADVLLDDRIPPTRKGRVYERRVLRRVRPAFLSVTAFCAIRLPMLLPHRVSDAYLGAACFAYRVLRSAIHPRDPGEPKQAVAPARPPVPAGPIATPPASLGRLWLERCFLAALLGSLTLFWILRIPGAGVASPSYGLRTIVFTGLATLFCLAHARTVRGSGFALTFLGVTVCGSLTAELTGTLTGLVFGPYRYSPEFPGKVLGLVPIVVPFAWFVMSYLSFATTESVVGAGAKASSVGHVIRAGVAAALFVAYDLVADPNHVYRGGWVYTGGGAYYGVPLQNFVAWGALGFVAFLLLGSVSRPPSPWSTRPSALLAVLAYEGVLVHESVFALLVAGHRGPGVLGLAVTAIVFALWWMRARQPSPVQGVVETVPVPAGRSDTRLTGGRVTPLTGAGPPAHSNGQRLAATLASVRSKDVLVLQGPPLMGVMLGWTDPRADELWTLLLFLLATWLLVAHVFGLNDWAGIDLDRGDTNKTDQTFLARGVTPWMMGLLVAGLGVLSLSLFSLLPLPTFLTAGTIAGLSLLYSYPAVAAKGIPIVSSLLHVAGGFLHFSLGYSLFGTLDRRATLLGLYFGIVFAAGHLTQEVGDRDADRLSGIQTNAVRFGSTGVSAASFALFSVSYGLIFALSTVGLAPRALSLVILLYPVHAWLFWRTLRADLTFESVRQYRARYRGLFLLIGAVIAVAFLGRLAPP